MFHKSIWWLWLISIFSTGYSVTEIALNNLTEIGDLSFTDDHDHNSRTFRSWLRSVLETYDSRLRPNFGVTPLRIRLGLSLIGISSMSESAMEFSVEMFFYETWNDHRLAFDRKLFGNRDPVTLPLTAPQVLWIPDTSFLNALRSQVPKVGSVSHLHSMMLFSNGTIGYSRRLSVTAQCHMDLSRYPFDKQACRLELSSYGLTIDDVVYEWIRKEIPVDKLQLADFFATRSLVNVIIRNYSAGSFSVPYVCIEFSRRAGFCTLQVFVPGMAVVCSSWISLWLDQETQFTDILAVILAIIFLSQNSQFARVNYVKAVDIYIGACFIFVFLSLVKLAIVKYMHAVVRKRKEKAAGAAQPSIVVEATPMTAADRSMTPDQTPLMMDVTSSCGPVTTTTLVSASGTATMTSTAAPLAASTSTVGSLSTPMESMIVEPIRRRMSSGNRGRHHYHKSFKNRLASAAPSTAAVRRVLRFRLAGMPHVHLPSLHDNYWRCMKAFHLVSQLILPVMFGVFAGFYFFVLPYLPQEGSVCT